MKKKVNCKCNFYEFHPCQPFVILTCHDCSRTVSMMHMMALESDIVTGDIVKPVEFLQLSNKYYVSTVPKVGSNKKANFDRALPEKKYLEKVIEVKGPSKKS